MILLALIVAVTAVACYYVKETDIVIILGGVLFAITFFAWMGHG